MPKMPTRLGLAALLANAVTALAAPPTPQLIAPGTVSTTNGEYAPTFDVHRQELIFMRRTPGEFDYTLYSSTLTAAGWSKPTVLPFSGRYRDGGPSLSPDGQTLVFDSRRPDAALTGPKAGGIELWQVQRDDAGWTTPKLIKDASLNPDDEPEAQKDEFGPLLTGDGALWWYSFRRPFRGGAYYRRDANGAIERIDALPDPSAPTFIAYLTLSTDGETAVMEGRAVEGSGTDLYYACHGGSGWSAAKPLEAANTQFSEGTPYLAADGHRLFFASDRAEDADGVGTSNLYEIATKGLPIPCD